MDNQKDTLEYQKDTTITTEVNSLNIKVFSEFTIKKTEKLVTALYMVTDCMDDDTMKTKLRSIGVELLSNSHSFLLSNLSDKQYNIDRSNTHIAEIISLIEIATMMGFISEMNSTILKKEFALLKGEYARFETENSTSTNSTKKIYSNTQISLNEQSLAVQLPTYKQVPLLPSQFWNSPIDKGQKDNKTVLYKNQKDIVKPTKSNTLNKEERSQKMLDLIKEKGEISIKDISYSFTDCSEKTIQRELNNLVLKGQLKKVGSKRWSRYSVI